jgi:hypothetical protein
MRLPLLAAAILAVAATLSAATVPRMSFERIVRSSPRAIRGEVVRSWSAWDEAHAAIWTHYEIRVAETLRGPAAAMFTISEPGGAVGDLAMRVPGAPEFAVGEKAVFFTYPTPLGYWRVSGWGQGRFRIDEQDGGLVVRSPQPGAAILDMRPAAAKAAAVSERGGQSLEAFLERTRALIRLEEGR